ncbi:MAG: Rrf2 family transcriptional regulator [Halanaerobiales bacterium]|nr:Rrf2 family transcriptional regulator [Halanaerobiales bacterium]
MQISLKSEYAIHSLMILALYQGEEISVDELAMMQQISQTYLAKVMQKLANTNLVQSSKGFKGGYTLNLSPHEITLAKVVTLFEKEEQFYDCKDQERSCLQQKNCTLHKTFQQAYKAMIRELEKVCINDLLSGFLCPTKETKTS